MLIIGRAIAGIGAAGTVTGVLSTVGTVLPMRKRPLFISIIQSTFGIATIVAPVLGGVLTQRVSWRWCFYINLPAGAITFITVVFSFSPPRRSAETESAFQRLLKLNLIGAVHFIPAVVMVLMALQWGGSTYAWKSAMIIGLFCGFFGLITIFFFWQIFQGDSAMIPPALFTQRTVFTGSVAVFLAMGAVMTTVYLWPAGMVPSDQSRISHEIRSHVSAAVLERYSRS